MRIGVLLFLCLPLIARGADESDVLAVMQRLFDAMATRDVKTAAALLMPESRFDFVREDGTVGGTARAAFLERLGAGKEKLDERMVNPRVLVHGRIASVWTQYTFHRDGKFSHCGVDSAQLLKTPGGWKIASLAYTLETRGCPAEP